jgi:hypothetical protein
MKQHKHYKAHKLRGNQNASKAHGPFAGLDLARTGV